MKWLYCYVGASGEIFQFATPLTEEEMGWHQLRYSHGERVDKFPWE